MYKKAYGIIETLAPVHVGASAGEETGNLNLIFRDQFTQTGVIPGSSIRGRFRADMRSKRFDWLQDWINETLKKKDLKMPDNLDSLRDQLEWLEDEAKIQLPKIPKLIDEHHWYGHSANLQGKRKKETTQETEEQDEIDQEIEEQGGTTEALVKFEYASLVWLPVFCPGQPIVWVTCPWLLRRYKQIADVKAPIPKEYTAARNLKGRQVKDQKDVQVLFFNLGFLTVESTTDLSPWCPESLDIPRESLVVVSDKDISMLHDMALYRQSRVRLHDEMKKVDGGGFFNVEALPEGSVLVFPIACKETGWEPFGGNNSDELYFGGLESIGFGRCRVTLPKQKGAKD